MAKILNTPVLPGTQWFFNPIHFGVKHGACQQVGSLLPEWTWLFFNILPKFQHKKLSARGAE
jgi:hypothetical protein